ncbi:predicted protein [Sclerotinia sclerotiorum 1980 UF-70]|uniref:Uncharacterized protein n=1 Tax=Sclerotinia sclerotiorum (strain ATCC 18683 / 1980 / Ss-1) TaxID=665079 RepID=A7ESK2_SCLS1|nr:predicted protein [Sclerotinia sclerotiorum 1980 UF-70]EDN92444.1 predicted protein [Sclerotinia sclerotiorum 1980 UF-70]
MKKGISENRIKKAVTMRMLKDDKYPVVLYLNIKGEETRTTIAIFTEFSKAKAKTPDRKSGSISDLIPYIPTTQAKTCSATRGIGQ